MLLLLVAAPAWLRSGTPVAWYRIGLPLGAAVWLIGLVLNLAWLRKREPTEARVGRRRLFGDPILWLGLLFISLLSVQWWNSGRALFFDTAEWRWAHSPPPHPDWPFAFTAGDARQMLDWFVPAWVLLALLRSPLMTPPAVRQFWRLLVYNAGALALFGLVQHATSGGRLFWRWPMEHHFFATFGYANHAGAYFLLAFPLALGLISHEFAVEDEPRRWPRILLLGACFFLALVGANLSLSRVSILLSWALLLPMAALLLAFFWPRMEAAHRVNVAAVSLGLVCLAVLLTFGWGRDAIRREFKPAHDELSFVEREYGFRAFQVKAAARIWKDHPWFGAGGWGYRYLLPQYLAPEDRARLGPGKANAHNDPAQYLAEFGAVGAGALALAGLILLAAVARSGAGWPPLVALPLLGVAVVAGQSLIDLPFRSPAVLCLWLAAVGGAARALAERTARYQRHVD